MTDERRRNTLHNKLKSILAAVNTNNTVPLTYTVACEHMATVEEQWVKLQVIQESMENSAVGEEAYTVQVGVGEEIEKSFHDVRGKLRSLIKIMEISRASSSTATSTVSSTKIKLPTMSLPNFDGKFGDWTSFKDLFTAAIANNRELTDAQKLQYLKTALRGEPAGLITYLTTTDVNYTEAWRILTERYDNKREIVQSHLNKLLDLAPVKQEIARDLQSLLDTCLECLRSLKVLGCPTDQWDDWLVVMIGKKLDSATRREWAKRLTGNTLPTFTELESFLTSHIRGLQAAGTPTVHLQERRGERQVKVHHANEAGHCPACSGSHLLQECKEFLSKNVVDRNAFATKRHACYNCLKTDHRWWKCKSSGRCKRCGRKHHTLLHEEAAPVQGPSKQRVNQVAVVKEDASSDKEIGIHHVSFENREGVLMTAVVNVKDRHGKLQPCRVFVDPGAASNLILEKCVQRLGLPRKANRVTVKGIGDVKAGTSKGTVTTTLFSRFDSSQSLQVNLHVLNKLTGSMPSVRCRGSNWKHLEGLSLADPEWNVPGSVDLLIGVEYFHQLLLQQRRVGVMVTDPVAWETIFGWIISGACPIEESAVRSIYHLSIDPLVQQLKKFWEVEEPPKQRILTSEEKKCEQHFLDTYNRDSEGRFTVGVPFNENRKELGKSKFIALKRLYQVERRLQRKPDLQQQYVEFMSEYSSLGHMEEICGDEQNERLGETNYLCHHFVTNESSTTTKLRVVFDGSAPTSSGVCLNETMSVGATLQDDLYDLLLRFRVHAIVLKADIAKMFRQFRLRKEDADMHRILWRESPDLPVKEYRLKTVTYGTACAPNLATRCLQQLGKDVRSELPLASRALLNDAYVDDILTGTTTHSDALKVYSQLQTAVSTAGMELRKWTSNDRTVLGMIPEDLRETDPCVFDEHHVVKALGVQWHPLSDEFQFKCLEFDDNGTTTKRNLLADLSRLFDPLGLISCVTLRGKLMLQELWKLPVDWDDEVPLDTKERWQAFKEDLQHLKNLTIPRRITFCGAERLQMHGFADSSESAFGAIVYLRSILPNGTIGVRFITSKTRVAPVRQVTLPRLELCAAVCLAELVSHVNEVMKLDCSIHLWSDSTITLRWIAATPRKWKTYIANRVASIQELTTVEQWKHVAGIENPADLASRGTSVLELCSSDLWWNGAPWLSEPILPQFPLPSTAECDMEERMVEVQIQHVRVEEPSLLMRFSSLSRLRRCVAWRIRYLHFKITRKCQKGPLTALELHQALRLVIKKVQQQHFSDDIKQIQLTGHVKSNSILKSLVPFIDNFGILRVTGRTENANIPKDVKHQVILPKNSHLTDLLIHNFHEANFHSGFQLTWSKLLLEYWILGGRDKVRHHVRSCVRCIRFRARAAEQLMGALPEPRVNPCRPFMHTGVDYAGPFSLKNTVGRIPKTYKGYLCLFVCLTTKAIHLEVVSTLSTEGFIAALRRFVARRNLCTHIYSDCGTNFVGAERELWSFLQDGGVRSVVGRELGEQGITWHFNPPASPHRGGIWEAGVKSAKHHLRRVMGEAPLTFEQFTTIACQIEAILNSRPLYPMSPDPADLQPLTPAHFLLGAPSSPVPDLPLEGIPRNRLSLYQRLQKQVQQFWQRWSSEYLNTLQQRNKWMWEKENVRVGDMVLLMEPTSPGTWRMGRVIQVHPGKDGKIRVATVKTAASILERPIQKLVLLISGDD